MKRSPSDIINYIYWQQDSRLVVLPNDEWIKKYKECQAGGSVPDSETRRFEWADCAKKSGIAYKVKTWGKYKELRTYSPKDGYIRYSTNNIDPFKDGRSGTEAIQEFLRHFNKLYGGDNGDSHTFSRVFGTAPEDVKLCVPKQFYWINENLKYKTLQNVSSVDDSAHYPSSACGRLPNANTAVYFDGQKEPTEEYPFAFYIKSGHLCELGRVDTRKWLDSPFMTSLFDWDGIRKGVNKSDPYLPPEKDVTILMKPAKVTLDAIWLFYYEKRNEDPTAKLVMVAVIGNWHRKRYNCYKYAHLAAVTIARANEKMLQFVGKRIGNEKAIHICVDGCVYSGGAVSDEKKEFGKFVQEFERCEFQMVGMNCYMAKKGIELVKFKHGAFNYYEDGRKIDDYPPEEYKDMLKWKRINHLEECT